MSIHMHVRMPRHTCLRTVLDSSLPITLPNTGVHTCMSVHVHMHEVRRHIRVVYAFMRTCAHSHTHVRELEGRRLYTCL